MGISPAHQASPRQGTRMRVRQKKSFEDAKEWTDSSKAESQIAVEDRTQWKEIVMASSKVRLERLRE